MRKPTATCPNARAPVEHVVRIIGGSGRDQEGRDFYKYRCSCGVPNWRQIRVDQLKPNEIPSIQLDVHNSVPGLNIQKRDARQNTQYLCSKCGMPKRNHTCRGRVASFLQTNLPAVPSQPPSSIDHPRWYVDTLRSKLNDMHLFMFAIEKANLPWSSDFVNDFTQRFELSNEQFKVALDIHRASCPQTTRRASVRCDKCNLTSVDEMADFVVCSCCKRMQRHRLCGASDGWICDSCQFP